MSAILAFTACGADDSTQIEASPAEKPTTDTAPPATTGTQPPSSSNPGATAGEIGAGAWVLGEIPDGFGPAIVQELDTGRMVVYQHESNPNDLFDGPLRITTSLDGPDTDGIPGAEEVALHGQTGYLFPLWDDGVSYGTAVMWPDDQQRWVMLMWGDTISDDEVLAIAASARLAGPDEWAELNRTLGTAAVIGGQVPDAVEEVVVEATSADGIPYQLIAFVPPDYPLNANDGRLTCFRLDVDGRAGDRRCNSHGWSARFGGATVIYGFVGTEATEVMLSEKSIDGSPVDETVIVTDLLRTAAPAPVAFFLAEVPGWCWVDVAVAQGASEYSMPGGPLPADEHHSECMASTSAAPSTTAGP